MAKTPTDVVKATKGTKSAKKTNPSSEDASKKQRKQQAKREAKLMLKVEQAKKDVQKAEQKLARAQTNLEDARKQQHNLEEKVARLRAPQQESHNGIPAAAPTSSDQSQAVFTTNDAPLTLSTPFINQSADTNNTLDTTSPPDTTSSADQPPAEGRTDVSQEQTTPSTDQSSKLAEKSTSLPAGVSEEDAKITSDNVSMPILTQNENPWPPPVIQNEIKEAVVEEATSSTPHSHDTPAQDKKTGETDGTKNTQQRNTSTRRRTNKDNT